MKFQHKQPDAYMSEDSEHDSIPDTSSFRDAVHFDLATDIDDNCGAHASTKSVASELLSQQKTGDADSSRRTPFRAQRRRGSSSAPG